MPISYQFGNPRLKKYGDFFIFLFLFILSNGLTATALALTLPDLVHRANAGTSRRLARGAPCVGLCLAGRESTRPAFALLLVRRVAGRPVHVGTSRRQDRRRCAWSADFRTYMQTMGTGIVVLRVVARLGRCREHFGRRLNCEQRERVGERRGQEDI